MDSTTQKTQSTKRLRPDDSDSDNDTEHQNLTWPRFVVIESVHEGDLAKLSPFAISKGINGLAGEPKTLKRLRSGAYLVEVTRKSHSDNLLKSTTLAMVPIRVTPHRTLNSKKGVVWCREFDMMSEDELKAELSSQQVTEVKRISVTRAGKKEKTHTYILTFGSPYLPAEIKAGYMKVSVKSYIPNPMRCFKCQRFGHHRDKCKSLEVCERCGNADHSKEHCEVDPVCTNCKGKHAASSKDCPTFKKEKEITKIKIEKNLPYSQARKVYESQTAPVAKKLFAAVVAQGTPRRTVGVQTDPTSKDVGKVLTPSKKEKVKPSQTNSKASQSDTKEKKKDKPKKNLGSLKSVSQKASNQEKSQKNGDKGPMSENRFEILSDDSDMEIDPPRSGSTRRNRSSARKEKSRSTSRQRSRSSTRHKNE